MFAGESRTEGRDEGVGLRGGNAVAATADQIEPLVIARGGLRGGETERTEEIDVADQAAVVGPGGKDADDFMGFALNAEGAADDVGGAGEASLPDGVAEEGHAMFTENLFL